MNDDFIRQIGNSGDIESIIGCSLYRFISEIDTEESSIGEIVANRADRAKGQYFRVLGMDYPKLGSPVQVLSKSNVGIEAKNKFNSFNGKQAKQLLREFLNNHDITDVEAVKIIEKIEANKLMIMPLKPKMTCKVYVEDNNKGKRKAEVIPIDANREELKGEPSISALKEIEDNMPDYMSDSDLEDMINSDNMDKTSGYAKKAGNAFRLKRSEIVRSKEIESNGIERSVDIEKVSWEINKTTGQLECSILTDVIEGTGGKRVRASIEEYGETMLLGVIENTIMPTTGAEKRKFIQISRFGYIKPIQMTLKNKAHIIIDNNYMYEIMPEGVKVIGFWDTKNRLTLLNGVPKDKIDKNKELVDSLGYIAQHRRFIAPYKLVECNIIK